MEIIIKIRPELQKQLIRVILPATQTTGLPGTPPQIPVLHITVDRRNDKVTSAVTFITKTRQGIFKPRSLK